MVSNPEARAVTIPVLLTEALVLLLLHTPPETASVKATGVPAHTLPEPVEIVTFRVATEVPQLLLTV
jgi:hypothetical protein